MSEGIRLISAAAAPLPPAGGSAARSVAGWLTSTPWPELGALASLEFLAFLGLAWAAFSALPQRLRAAWLLAASCAFYALAGAPGLLLVLLAGATVAYGGGRLAAPGRAPGARRVSFWAAVALEVLLLAALKYVPAATGARAIPALGVSYWVLTAIAYLADVYLEVHPPERAPARLGLHLGFFPKLVQGPIERAGDLLPQLRAPRAFDYARARAGLVLVAWGLFQKLVVADRAAPFVSAIYDDPTNHAGGEILVATYLFAIQIYFDFSGYTDVARGAAALFGITLVPNFDRPYAAASVADFWRRWHVSFSRWLLDYVFRPLQLGLRGWRGAATPLALLVTFVVSGVWHGAAWTFVAWGALHGAYLASSAAAAPWAKRAWRAAGLEGSALQRGVRVAVTFHLVCLAWVLFRARTPGDALELLARLALPTPGGWGLRTLLLGQDPAELAILIAALLGAALVARERDGGALRVLSRPAWVRWAFYAALVLATVVLRASRSTGFLYARF